MKTSLAVVGIVVTNMAETLDFYRKLGVRVPKTMDKEVHAEVELDGGIRLAFDTVEVIESYRPGYVRKDGESQVSLAFEFPTSVEVDKKTKEMELNNFHVEVQPFDAFWGQRYAVVLDPNNVIVDLFAPLS